MKTSLQLLIGFLLISSASAEFRAWTRNDGSTEELELVSVTDVEGEATGEFKMRSGRMITIKASVFTDADQKRLADWKPAAPTPVAPASVFDEVLEGNLVKLDGKSLKPFKSLEKPFKYYVFYYTASWCGPCHRFTPSLVKFYKKHKNNHFEVVLITSDNNEDAMAEYAREMKMPWPQLKLRKAADFKNDFKHGVTGIPSVIVCELDGKILGNFRNLDELENLVK